MSFNVIADSVVHAAGTQGATIDCLLEQANACARLGAVTGLAALRTQAAAIAGCFEDHAQRTHAHQLISLIDAHLVDLKVSPVLIDLIPA